MKKFKLFVLALFAMLNTNAFANVGDYDANTIFRFQIAKEYVASPEAVGSAMIVGFVAGYEGYATTKIPAVIEGATSKGKYKVVGIAANAFKDYAITTLDLSEAENLGDASLVAAANVATYVGIFGGAFQGTSIATLDLSATKITTVDQWFETTNKKVTTVKLPKTVTTIAASAFEGLSALNSVTFAEQTAPAVYGLTINADAFKNTMKLKTLTLPANVTSIAAGAFEKTYLETLTINGALAANSVATGAFVKNGSQKLTFTYAPAEADEVNNAIAQDAFSANTPVATGADVWVTFKTTTHYGNALAGYATYVADAKGNKFYGAELDFTPTALSKITVYNNGGSYAYGGYTVPATYVNGIKIAKKQGENKDINVMVYGAYFDNIGGKGTNSAVMMDQLHLIGGYYWIPAGTNVIVKSSSDAGVEFEAMTAAEAANDSRNHKVGSTAMAPILQNEIEVYDNTWGTLADGEYAINVIDYYNANLGDGAGGYTLYFLRDLKGGKEFGFKQREDDSVIEYGQLFLAFKGTAAARIDVVWLDGSEEDATAIKAVKTAAEKGAIYNLAGQKVNAAYKGVVIKDGKKYIQK